MTTKKISIKIINGKGVKKYWEECNKLSLKMCFPSYFCSGEWLSMVYKTIMSKEKFLMIVVEYDYKVIGLLPLIENTNIINVKVLRYLGYNYYPDPIGIICRCEDRKLIIEEIKKYLLNNKNWDLLEIKWISKNECIDWGFKGEKITISPFLELPQNIDVLLSKFKRKKRYNLKSSVQQVEKYGGQFIIPSNKIMRLEFLNELYRLHKIRSSERSIKSSFEGENIEHLHRNLVKVSDSAKLYGLKINEQIIAVIYGFEFSKQFFYYQIAHNPKFGNLSPGSVLLYYVIKKCCEKGLKQFNFLQGNEIYKTFWTKNKIELYGINLTNTTYCGRLIRLSKRAKKFIKNILKKVIDKK